MSIATGAADLLTSASRPGAPAADRRLSTPERILYAAAARIVASGTANLSMQDVADAAGVSKGLIHYHFHDKETLLTRLIEWMTHESVARETSTLARSTPKTAVDDLWMWVAGEIERGHLRVLNELAQERGPLISDAIRRSARARREAAMVTVDRLFALLELRPRVPVQLLADVIVEFIDGLAIHASLAPEANHRVAFDVLWLSLLSLAE